MRYAADFQVKPIIIQNALAMIPTPKETRKRNGQVACYRIKRHVCEAEEEKHAGVWAQDQRYHLCMMKMKPDDGIGFQNR